MRELFGTWLAAPKTNQHSNTEASWTQGTLGTQSLPVLLAPSAVDAQRQKCMPCRLMAKSTAGCGGFGVALFRRLQRCLQEYRFGWGVGLSQSFYRVRQVFSPFTRRALPGGAWRLFSPGCARASLILTFHLASRRAGRTWDPRRTELLLMRASSCFCNISGKNACNRRHCYHTRRVDLQCTPQAIAMQCEGVLLKLTERPRSKTHSRLQTRPANHHTSRSRHLPLPKAHGHVHTWQRVSVCVCVCDVCS